MYPGGGPRNKPEYFGCGCSLFPISFFLPQHSEVRFAVSFVIHSLSSPAENGADCAFLMTLRRIRPRSQDNKYINYMSLISLSKVAFGGAVSNLIMEPETNPIMNGLEKFA